MTKGLINGWCCETRREANGRAGEGEVRSVEEMVRKKLTPPADGREDRLGRAVATALRPFLSSNFCLSLGYIPSHCSPRPRSMTSSICSQYH